MRKDTAPGTDGFTPLFYQHHWALVHEELIELLHNFHRGTTDLQRINKAFLALLSKKESSMLPKDFRPISLQNCVTKICTKGMTMRLQEQRASCKVLVQATSTCFCLLAIMVPPALWVRSWPGFGRAPPDGNPNMGNASKSPTGFQGLHTHPPRDGKRTSFWLDHWIGLKPLAELLLVLVSHSIRPHISVHDAWDACSGT